MRILFTCGREPGYVRNRMVLRALEALGPVDRLTDDSPSYARRLALLGLRLLRGLPAHDLAFVGFLGYPLVFPVRLLTSRPLVFDAFLSTFDTLCLERRRFRADSLVGRLLRGMDRQACLLADLVLVDTEEHRARLAELLDVPAERFAVLPVGVEDDLFRPAPLRPADGPFHVFYYGSFLPLQGVEHLLRAAALLPEVRFTVAGDGPLLEESRRLARELGCDNVDFSGWVPYERLPERIAGADLCLGGHFTSLPKAAAVVSTKAYQFLAVGRPTILGDLPANRRLFAHGREAWMVPCEDPQALAGAIRHLQGDPLLRETLAREGARRVRESFSQEAVARRLQGLLAGLAGPGVPDRAEPPLTLNAWLRVDRVDRLLRSLPEVRTILEVGCGQGALGTRLAEHYDYVGVERDPRSLEVARTRLGERVQAHLPGRTFDLVCAFEVLEHQEDDEAALREWRGHVRPGGWLLLSVPADPRQFGAADRLAGHWRRYSEEDLARVLGRSGFVDVRTVRYGGPFGYLLQAGRNLLARRTGISGDREVETNASGRWMQPSIGSGWRTRALSAPFRALQRLLPIGPGLVALARNP